MTKKEESMQTQTQMPPLPAIPKREAKRYMQGEINAELWDAVDRERKKRKLTKRRVLEYGLVAFLQQANPQAAAAFIRKLEIQS